MEMSDLPKDLLEEIIYRVPVNSIRAVRSTCKSWNTITYNHSFVKKHFGKTIETKENEFLVVTMMDDKVYLMSVNLHGIQQNDNNNIKSSIMQKAKLTSLHDDAYYRVDKIYEVFHCDGLLLCIKNDIKNGIRLVVCNPYCGQTKCIKTRNAYYLDDQYALGYEKKKNSPLRNYKILVLHNDISFFQGYWSEIYNFNSDSWKIFYFSRDWKLPYFHLGVSLKGNTYWFAIERYIGHIIDRPGFLICFDFTTERFGPRLHLPFDSRYRNYTVRLSSVREEQLAVLFQCRYSMTMEIWVTTKISPKKVSWNKVFLAVNMRPHTRFQFQYWGKSFFIDDKKNVVVVPVKDELNRRRICAYITGNNGYFKQVDLGDPTIGHCDRLVCSYFPSLVQIKQTARVMQHHHSVLVGKDGSINCFGYFGFLYFLCIFLSYLCFR